LSQLAKIFTVLVLILSVVFVTATLMLFAQRQNWRAQTQERESRISQLRKEMAKQKEDYEGIVNEKNEAIRDLENKVADQNHLIDTLTAERDKALADQKQAELALARLQDDHKVAIQTLQQQTSRASRLEGELETAKKERQEAFSKMQQAIDARRDAEAKLASLETKLKDVERALYKANQEIAAMKRGTLAEGKYVSATEKINGRIRKIEGDIFLLDVGSVDGVRERYLFTVYRGDKYLGQLVATKVTPDYTIAEVVPETTKEPGKMRENDNVTTRLDIR